MAQRVGSAPEWNRRLRLAINRLTAPQKRLPVSVPIVDCVSIGSLWREARLLADALPAGRRRCRFLRIQSAVPATSFGARLNELALPFLGAQ